MYVIKKNQCYIDIVEMFRFPTSSEPCVANCSKMYANFQAQCMKVSVLHEYVHVLVKPIYDRSMQPVYADLVFVFPSVVFIHRFV